MCIVVDYFSFGVVHYFLCTLYLLLTPGSTITAAAVHEFFFATEEGLVCPA